MSFFRDCWESVRGNVRNCLSTPLSRTKLLVFGGIFVGVVLLVIILVFTLGGSSSPSTTSGSDVFNRGPLSFGRTDNSWLKAKYLNQISKNFPAIATQLDLDNLVKSKLRVMVWSVGASDCSQANQKDAIPQTLEGIDAASRLAANFSKQLTTVTDSSSLTEATNNNKIAMMLALDGGYTIDSRLAVLRMYYNLGIRIMTLTGTCSTPWAGNSATNKTLTEDFGKRVLSEANRMGLLVDLAGSSSGSISTVLANSTAPVIFNGVGSKNLTDNQNNLDDATLVSIKGKGHVVLVTFKCSLVEAANKTCTSRQVMDHLNHIKSLSGSSSVGIAADFGGAPDDYPTDLRDMKGVTTLFDTLHKQDWSLSELEGLAYKNFLNALQKAQQNAATSAAPDENYETKDELVTLFANDTLACYSDLAIRYPKTNGTAPATNGPAPATDGTAPATKGTAPATKGTAPATKGTAPATNGTAPATNGTAPAINGTDPNKTTTV